MFLMTLAHAQLALGDLAPASPLVERCIDIWRCRREHCHTEKVLGDGVELCLLAGRSDLAHEIVGALEGLVASAAMPLATARLADGLGLIAASEGRPCDAASAFGRAAASWRELGMPYEEARARRQLAASLLQAGDRALQTDARAELAAARAIFETLGALRELAAVDALIQAHYPPPPVARRTELTRRERQVIALLAHGYSNRAIAEALVISEKTAEIHVSNILGKLGFSSRAQAAAYAVEHHLAETQPAGRAA
jgi:DNA-binding CsgD family transcriptional regulator